MDEANALSQDLNHKGDLGHLSSDMLEAFSGSNCLDNVTELGPREDSGHGLNILLVDDETVLVDSRDHDLLSSEGLHPRIGFGLAGGDELGTQKHGLPIVFP